MVSWHWTRPHASFDFRFTLSTGPLDVVMRSICHFPVPRLAAYPVIRVDLTCFIFQRRALLSLCLSPFLQKVSTPHVPCPRVDVVPLSLSNPGICPCWNVSGKRWTPNARKRALIPRHTYPSNCFVLLALSSFRQFRSINVNGLRKSTSDKNRLSLHAFKRPPLLTELGTHLPILL
jgi:hypothetical protein